MNAYSLRKKRREIVLLIITLLICFIILEAITRSVWYPPQDKGYPKELHVIDDNLGYKLSPLYRGNFPMAKYQDKVISVNSKGLRDAEHSYEKENNKVRILGLGDSVTFGSGVNNNETYLSLIQKGLLEKGKNVETINSGVSGYELYQEYTFYKNEGYKYDSDIIIIGIVLNDIFEPNITQIKANMISFGYPDRPADTKTVKFVKSVCQTCVFFYGLLNNYNNKYFETIYNKWSNEQAFGTYEKRIEDLNKNLTSEKKQLVLVIFPYTQQFANSKNSGILPQEKIIALAEKNNITVIDLLPYLDVKDYNSLYIYGDNLHFNEKGNEIAAKAISNWLIDKKIV